MNSRSGRRNTGRVARTFKLSPTTCAIRAALAVSTTVLALSGGVAFAGTCANTADNTVSCNGEFTETVPGGIFLPTIDLTLVLGDSAPTSVTPGYGVVGIDATWGGLVGLTSFADISSEGADGVHAYGSTSAVFNNYGSLDTDVSADDAQALDIGASGDVTVVNGGEISATGSGDYDVAAVTAYSLHGNVVFTNQTTGAVTATSAGDGNALGIETVVHDGYAFVYNHGDIVVDGANAATGTTSLGRASNTINDGAITVTANNGIATGMAAHDVVSSYFSNAGTLAVASDLSSAIGIDTAGATAYGAGFVNSGTVSVSGGDAATGVLMSSSYHSYGVNRGTIAATAGTGDAIGVFAEVYGAPQSFYASHINNFGTIAASSDYGHATGILFESDRADAVVNNAGAITATSGYGVATGILIDTKTYANGYAVNSGSIDVSGYQADGINVHGYAGGAYVDNSGDITVAATAVFARASGILAESHSDPVRVDNSGSISVAVGLADASGIVANSPEGTVSVSNGGDIDVRSNIDHIPFDPGSYYSGRDYAIGITAQSDKNIAITNAGDITAQATFKGEGIHAYSLYDEVTVTNAESGSIAVSADIYGWGIAALSYDGAVAVDNRGDIAVSGNGNANTKYSEAIGILSLAKAADITVDNSGAIAIAATNISGLVTHNVGVLTRTTYGSTAVVNSGDIRVDVDGGESTKTYTHGIWASTTSNLLALDNGAITVLNAGNIDIDVLRGTSSSGIYVNSWTRYGDGPVEIVNSGDIDVTAIAGSNVHGIEAFASAYGDLAVNNSGNITATNNTFVYGTRYDGSPFVIGGASMGIEAEFSSAGGNVAITNSGDIDVTGGSLVQGIYARYIERTNYFSTGDLLIDNSGSISATANTFDNASAAYIAVSGIRTLNDDGNTTLINSGSITANVVEDAVGPNAFANVQGIQIAATSPGETPPEIEHLAPGYGMVSITNSGSIEASITSNGLSYAGIDSASGVLVVHGYGMVELMNSGLIAASAQSDAATATGADTIVVSGINISKNRRPSAVEYAHGSETVVNGDTGWITASATSNYADASTAATGIFTVLGLSAGSLVTPDRAITIDNAGVVSATATVGGVDTSGSATAAGISAFSWDRGLVDLSNSGTVSAKATAIAAATASGLSASAAYGDVAVINSGDIGALAESSHGMAAGSDVTTATGIAVIAVGGAYDYVHAYHTEYNYETYTWDKIYDGVASTDTLGDITLVNDAEGTISARAVSSDGDGATSLAYGINGSAVIDAYGAFIVSAGTGHTLGNAGRVSAAAVVANDPNGIAMAYGISAVNGTPGGFSSITNSGLVTATATATADANAIGVLASANEVTVALDAGGQISALATGDRGRAVGLSVSGDLLTVSNAGAIRAEFVGSGATYGALLASATSAVTFTNSGSIAAIDADYAVGVQFDSAHGATLINAGTITSISSPAGRIAVRTGVAADVITNTGAINGALMTGDGDDTLGNALDATWNVSGVSDFGIGDDTIDNAGAINLDNARIDLGSSSTSGNIFSNTGTITVSGDANTIVMSGRPDVALAFRNNGAVDFRDGATDDRLTIAGDFAGQGDINVDVSGLHLASDRLYIDGNVSSDSSSAINVHLLQLPSTATDEIQVVAVSGNSIASNFVIGDVQFNQEQSFVTMDFDLDVVSDIDASNAAPDIFALGMSVTGLSDTGTLGALVTPGAQSLMASQIGTWRQRMGAIDKVARHGLNLWARFFTEKGKVTPEHTANNFGQGGNFDFDQNNSGTEIGADFAVSDQFRAGLVLAKVEADQNLSGSGIGRSALEGDSYGVYGTWLPGKGFYLDASYRTMSFDVTLQSRGGEVRGSGKANAFNVEAGYAWSLAGMLIEPQVQYTRTTVDDVHALDGALADFQAEGGDSSRARLGVMMRKTFGESGTDWAPYFAVSAVREFDGSSAFAINGDFTGTTSVEGTSALVESGVTARRGKLSVFAGLNWQDGGALDSFVGGQAGVRYAW